MSEFDKDKYPSSWDMFCRGIFTLIFLGLGTTFLILGLVASFTTSNSDPSSALVYEKLEVYQDGNSASAWHLGSAGLAAIFLPLSFTYFYLMMKCGDLP